MKNLSEMPYYNTSVDVDRSRMEINKLLKKFGITEYQWTKLSNHESIRFVFHFKRNGQDMKGAYELQIPSMRANYNRKEIEVPDEQKFRMLFFTLKSLLESTEYGIIKLEDILIGGLMLKSGITVKEHVLKDPSSLMLPV